MTDRLIDLADEAVQLSIRGKLLVIKRDSGEVTVPMNEIAAVVASHPSITLSHAVLAGLAEAGAMFVACNSKRMPASMLLPLDVHFTQAKRFRQQAGISLPLQKRLWKEIVRAKIQSQGRLLCRLYGNDEGLSHLARVVRSGDPANVEAQAARRYWSKIFDTSVFRRDREAEDQNKLLNYGYMVLRAIVSRAICASGLHPSLGLHHHNAYNAFQLADDLMEPFRWIVDESVVRLVRAFGPNAPLDKTGKAVIIGSLNGRFIVENEHRTLFDILSRSSSSLASVFAGERATFLFPELEPCPLHT